MCPAYHHHIMSAVGPVILLLLTTILASAQGGVIRVCVTKEGDGPCQMMLEDPQARALSLQCVFGDDRYGCLRKIMEKEADVTWGSAEDVFLIRETYGDQLQVVAESRTLEEKDSSWRYSGVAVVRKGKITSLADLRGSKSCHTGYERTAGWYIPFSHLLDKKLVDPLCGAAGQEVTVVEQDLRAASNFFGLACIPGRWAPDNKTNNMLKENYNNLCTMCGSPGQCDEQDTHAGYQGALRCLVDSGGDVAWTKLSAVVQFFKGRPEVSKTDYGLLCPDGRVQELDSPKACHWAARPWNTFIVRSANENKKGIVSAMTQMMKVTAPPPTPGGEGGVEVKPWSWSVFGVTKPSVVYARSPPVTPHDYLKEFGYDITIERTTCPSTPIKLCVESNLTHEKCQALSQVLTSRRVRPALACVTPTAPDDCHAMVASGAAHITSGDGGDVYRAHVEYGLTPVISERYGHLDASYFAVAVVKADSGITSLDQLRGKASCHTGIDRTAGWKIPVDILLEAGLLKAGACDFPGQVGQFFRASCAPGAKDPRYDPAGTNPESLCELCVGKEVAGASGPPYSGGAAESRCARSPEEAFSGYTGAFRCLVQGGGDVAFIKHTTVGDNTNGNNNASWAANLRALDYKLLCLNQGTAEVTDYSTCHLARVPAHKVMTNLKEGVMREEVRILLLRASEFLPPGQDIFNMFGPYRGRHDLIFKDSATELINVREDTFHKSLEDAYYRALTRLSSCTPKEATMLFTGSDQNAGGSSVSSSVAPVLSLLILGTLAFHIAH